jgi:uncharacterized protein (DUF488 family)
MNLRAELPRIAGSPVKEIFTIGHSTHSLEAFVNLLLRNEIELLVDVRRHPGSRHEPQFGEVALRGALAEQGIDYLHLPALGGRRRSRPDSPNIAWRNLSFRGYADHMETAEFRDGLEQLMALARSQRTAIMCAEAVWWRCHRALIADALTARGWQVWHIMGDGASKPHRLTGPAHVENGELAYHEMRPVAEQTIEQG